MRDKGSQEPEMLCKTKWYLYQEAAANETGNVDGCFFEAPDKSEASRSTSQSAYTAIGKDEPNTTLNSVIAPSQEPALRSQRGTTSTDYCGAIADRGAGDRD
jgi:hypothetical protein